MAVGGAPRPTATGVVVGCGAVALAALGWSLGYAALTVAGVTAGAAWVAAALSTLSVPRLDVSRIIEPLRVERGRPALGLLSVKNVGSRRSTGCTADEVVSNDTARDLQASTTTVHVDIPSLAAGRSVAVTYELPTTRRGALQVGPLSLTRSDPFGLWEARRPLGDTVVLLVQPRVYAIDPRRGGRTRHLEGPVSDTAPRGTSTFHSLREYTAGDDIRRVHWRSTARSGTLMVREHVDTSLPSTVIVLDTRTDRYANDLFEEAVDVAASVVASAQTRGFPIRLITTAGASFVVRAGQRGLELRDYLTTVMTEVDGSLRRATVEVLRGRDHDAITVISSDVDAVDLAEVTSMAQRFASSSLVTVRSAGGLRWSSGTHLDAPTAATALLRWQHNDVDRTSSGVSA